MNRKFYLYKHTYWPPRSTSVWHRYFLAFLCVGQPSKASSKSLIAFIKLPLVAYLQWESVWDKGFVLTNRNHVIWKGNEKFNCEMFCITGAGAYKAPRATSASTLFVSISKALLYSFIASTWWPDLKLFTPAFTLQEIHIGNEFSHQLYL